MGSRFLCLSFCFSFLVSPTLVAGEFVLHPTEALEIPVISNDSASKQLVIWFPSEHGLPESLQEVGKQLASTHVAFWQLDLYSAWFLPVQASSIEQFDIEVLADVINQAVQKGFSEIYLASSGRGSVPLLRALRQWQTRFGPGHAIRGIVLLYPNLYYQTPRPGEEARYLPIASASNYPVFILQPALSPWRWNLARLMTELSKTGSPVYTQILPEVRDRFYFRPDASEPEKKMTQALASHLLRATRQLKNHLPPTTVPALQARSGEVVTKQLAVLRPVLQRRPPDNLDLEQLQGGRLSLDKLRGRVVLVNFWATWCPPCVHEMPSMQVLQDKLRDRPFSILAVNMAETDAVVRQFLATRVQVKFPIAMDREGEALKRWKVFAFPTSYLIDKKGNIRYALFGGIDWSQAQVRETIESLLAE